MDAISLLKRLQEVKLLTKVLMTPLQKLLLQFHRRNIIKLESSAADSASDDNI
jgi:hypothetical protein